MGRLRDAAARVRPSVHSNIVVLVNMKHLRLASLLLILRILRKSVQALTPILLTMRLVPSVVHHPITKLSSVQETQLNIQALPNRRHHHPHKLKNHQGLLQK
ncbi:hypothetical protein Peur_016683 [Populus x canadensis]